MPTDGTDDHAPLNPLLPATPDLIWGSVVFVGLAIFFTLYVLPRVKKALDARAEIIEGGISKAENAQAEAAAALEEYTKQLAEARAEAARIREQARADGNAIIAELKEQATVEANRVTANAKAATVVRVINFNMFFPSMVAASRCSEAMRIHSVPRSRLCRR